MNTVYYRDGVQCDTCPPNSQQTTYYTGPGQRVVNTNPVVSYTTHERIVSQPSSSLGTGGTLTTNYVTKDENTVVSQDSNIICTLLILLSIKITKLF